MLTLEIFLAAVAFVGTLVLLAGLVFIVADMITDGDVSEWARDKLKAWKEAEPERRWYRENKGWLREERRWKRRKSACNDKD